MQGSEFRVQSASPPDLRVVQVSWLGGMRFSGGAPDGPKGLVDADNTEAPGPMLTLLLAAVGCAGADIVSILEKMQVKLRRFDAVVTGRRRSDHPRRYVTLHLQLTLAGEGLAAHKARRAIDLSITKYCSVINSLNPDIPVTYDVEIAE